MYAFRTCGGAWQNRQMSNRIVIGWVLFVLGIIVIGVLLLILVSLLLGSTCLVLVEKEYPGTVPWGQIAGPFIGTLFGLVVGGLAVWGGWRLSHPRRRIRRARPPVKSGDVSGE
jgi:hypothetical protein